MARIIQYSPMLRAVIPLLLGIVCATQYSIPLLLVVLLIVLSGVLRIFLRFNVLVYPMIFALGLFLISIHTPSSPLEECDDLRVTLKIKEGSTARIIAIHCEQEDEWQRCNHKVLLYDLDSTRYSTMVARVRVTALDRKSNSYYRGLNSQQIYHQATVIELESQTQTSPPLTARLNDWALSHLERLELNQESHRLTAAMTLARREMLSQETMQIYRRSGTSHVMALSGMHMGIVLLLVWWIFLPFAVVNRGHLVSNVFSIGGIWLFAVMAGLGDSILRAASMFTMLQLSLLFAKRYGSLNSLCSTLLIMLCFDPFAIYDLGFQLSFLSVAVIVVIAAPITRHIHLRPLLLDRAVKSVIVSCVASSAIIPIVSHYFGYIALVSPITTLLLLPTLSVIISVALLWIICPLPLLAPLFREVIEAAVTIQNYLASWFSQHGWGFREYSFSYSQMAWSYLILLLLAIICALLYQRYEPLLSSRKDYDYDW